MKTPDATRPSFAIRSRLIVHRKRTRTDLIIGAAATITLIVALMLANWVTTDYGFIPVGFGFQATAGTLFAGVAIAVRDLIQDLWGRLAVLLVIVIATGVSFGISAPEIAIASAAAFFTSETLNFVIYTPLRMKSKLGDRRWVTAVVAGDIVASIVDTVVFLGIAFGAAAIAPALLGQMVGKFWATCSYLIIGKLLSYTPTAKRRRLENPLPVVRAERKIVTV